MNDPDYSGDEFVGYIFQGSPERRPRLWFLDRQITTLFLYGACHNARRPGRSAQDNLDVGIWTLEPVEGLVYTRGHMRYQHMGQDPWTAVWRLTDTTIPRDPRDAERGFGVNTFGRDDDVWRLGVWPD